MAAKPKEQPSKSQVDKFKEAAKALETDDDEKRFDATLKKVAKAPKEAVTSTKKPS